MRYSFSPLIDNLIDAFCCLPGVGPKSAQRMAFYLLERGREKGITLSQKLADAMHQIKHCYACRNFSESELCRVCSSSNRNAKLLCVVETPLDVIAIEQTGQYKGYYFVLQGHLSPLDGIGPKELGLDKLMDRLQQLQPEEVILATNPTMQGEITAHHIVKMLKPYPNIRTSRIAHGVPMGSELEYVSETTLSHSIAHRVEI